MSLISDLFAAQLAIVKSDFAKDLLIPIQQANNLIAANPTALNAVAQGQKILTLLIAEGPTLLQDEVKQLANWVNQELQQLAAPPVVSAPPVTSAVSAASTTK